MSTFVLMRLLESAPRRYDMGIRLLSLGRSERLHARMAESVEAGERVLDVGCGTGSLALRCAQKGAEVTGIDSSPLMLDVASHKLATLDLGDKVDLIQMSAIDLDEKFEEGTFDVVVSSLMFSELSDDEQRFVLRECYALLRSGGRLLLADEVEPKSWWLRIPTRILRLPLVVITYILTQASTKAVADLDEKAADAGFTIQSVDRSMLGGLMLVVGAKDPED